MGFRQGFACRFARQQRGACATSPEIIRQTVAAYFAAYRALDADAFVATFATDGVMHEPAITGATGGHAALRQVFGRITAICEVIALTEQQVFVVGNEAAVKWTSHARGRNGAEVDFDGIAVTEMNDDGKIQSLHVYWDPAPMLATMARA